MTDEEAVKWALVISQADGACSECVHWLCEDATERFPDYQWELDGKFVIVTKLHEGVRCRVAKISKSVLGSKVVQPS